MLTSAKSDEEFDLLVRTSGADGYIRKPLNFPEVIAKVQGILN